MCGTRVERRAQERRGGDASSGGADALANPNTFSTSEQGRRSSGLGTRTLTQQLETQDQAPAAIPRSVPAVNHHISGPSFLGLNADPEGQGEYLLEDEQSTGGGALRKLLLVLVLVGIGTLIFVQWRSSSKANPVKTPVKTSPAELPTPAAENAAPATSPASSDNSSGATRASDAQKKENGPKAADPAKDDQDGVENATAAPEKSDGSAVPDGDTKTGGESAKDTVSDTAAAKVGATTVRTPSPTLIKAQQYLQGRGRPRSCEQGLLYLRAATQQEEPAAAIQMAALYSSGVCVRNDPAMAYHWYKRAYDLDPKNQWVQKNMNKLWYQMTSQERAQAER